MTSSDRDAAVGCVSPIFIIFGCAAIFGPMLIGVPFAALGL